MFFGKSWKHTKWIDQFANLGSIELAFMSYRITDVSKFRQTLIYPWGFLCFCLYFRTFRLTFCSCCCKYAFLLIEQWKHIDHFLLQLASLSKEPPRCRVQCPNFFVAATRIATLFHMIYFLCLKQVTIIKLWSLIVLQSLAIYLLILLKFYLYFLFFCIRSYYHLTHLQSHSQEVSLS